MAADNKAHGIGREPEIPPGGHDAQTPGNSELREYPRLKLAIADIVLAAEQMAHERKRERAAASAQRLLARIAEDRFNLAVVGLFNRGKSSLRNAVLGLDRLPVGTLPLTSVVTAVSYGSRERLLIQSEVDSLPLERPIAELTEYIVDSIEVTSPLMALLR